MSAQAIARAAARLNAATIERDRIIIEAHNTGMTLREIGRHAGISHVTVRNIIKRKSTT